MGILGDFIGGAAMAAKANIDTEMAEKADRKRAEWMMKAQEKYGIRSERRAEKRRMKENELAYDRAQIDAEARKREAEIRAEGLLARERLKNEQKTRDKEYDRGTQWGVAERYGASRTAAAAERDKRKQNMDFGFNSPMGGLLGKILQ